MIASITSTILKSATRNSASWSSRRLAQCISASSTSISSSSSSSSSTISSLRRFHTTPTVRQDPISSDSILPGSQPTSSLSTSTPSTSFRSNPSSSRSLFDPNRPHHRLHVQSSRNNTILTLTTPSGDPLASSSGGTAGFKKAQRSGYEAAYRAAFQMFGSINNNRLKWGLQSIEIVWKGFGQGREAVFRALMASEGQEVKLRIAKMIDATPIKIGGVRPKKRRML